MVRGFIEYEKGYKVDSDTAKYIADTISKYSMNITRAADAMMVTTSFLWLVLRHNNFKIIAV